MNHRPASTALCLLLFLLASALPLQAQQATLPLQPIPLDDLGAFRDVAGNWQVAGGVDVDRDAERALRPAPGTGVLVNVPSPQARDNLFTEMEHGDVELELEFLVPRGSNSGVYLMGRYEVQILDSWGQDRPTFADAGGIYQRWDPARGSGREGYEGRPPRVNASRAPGLWQRYHIVFRAPRFDDAGRKVENAQFVKVVHNGVVVHENVEVTGPTRAAAFEDEQPTGPLMLQGDHGPVAYRNIRYRRYGPARVMLSDLTYMSYDGAFETLADLDRLVAPTREGAADALVGAPGGEDDQYAVAYEGTITLPADGTYLFDLGMSWVEEDPHFKDRLTGAGRLYVGDDLVLVADQPSKHATALATLEAGSHPFRLVYFKNRRRPPNLTLEVEGPEMPRHALHDADAIPPPSFTGPIQVRAEAVPTLQRGFVMHDGEKRTHALLVGDPSGVHYAYDLAAGALLHAWRGPFADATPMWYQRGHSQLIVPEGSVLTLEGAPALARLASPDAPWPTNAPEDYHYEGYGLDDAGRPTVHYRLGPLDVHDEVEPAEDGPALRRTLRVSADAPRDDLYARLATADAITDLGEGAYLVGDRTYYVEVADGPAPMLRRTGSGHELLVPVRLDGTEGRVSYAIVW